MKTLSSTAVAVITSLCLCTAAFAQMGSQPDTSKEVVTRTKKVQPPAGFRGEFLHQLDDAQKELVSLAGAIPADKFSWRPAPGVRSVGEVYLHITRSNFGIPQVWGAKMDDPSIDLKNLEKLDADKAKTVALLTQSLTFVRHAVENLSDADLDRSISLFGSPGTVRQAMLILSNHMHEHLGQSIAYARMNGVVPPWSAPAAPAPAPASR
jgi:uncharacterized damage-inducible protein DinB